jgi:hypothetical protein
MRRSHALCRLQMRTKPGKFVPGNAGEWDTGTTAFGVVKGRGAIADLVKNKLPPPPSSAKGLM